MKQLVAMPLTGVNTENRLLGQLSSPMQTNMQRNSAKKFKIASQFDTAINDKYLRNDVLLKATAHAPRSIPNPLLSESSLEKLKSNNGLFQLSQQTKNLYLEKNSLIENSLAKKRLNVNLRISGTEGPIAKCARLTRSEDKLADTSSTVNDDVFPKYSFSRDSEKREHLFEWEIDDIEDRYRNDILKQTEVKKRLVDFVSIALIRGPNVKDPHDAFRLKLIASCEDVSCFDPEFILKLALFARQELNVRTTANLLLSFAAFNKNCRPFLSIYFDKCVILPSDWIDVAEQYQLFNDKSLKPGSLPSGLRKALTLKFQCFSVYHLAKYNKVKSKKKKKKKKLSENDVNNTSNIKDNGEEENLIENIDLDDSDEDACVEDDVSDNDFESIQMCTFTLKKLVRLLHLKEPAEVVMGLIGKRYPDNEVAFRESRLEGMWDKSRAGQRMKLPVPETWETQLSLKGNKKNTWEELLERKQVPYMAMLRNLRNIILAGVSEKYHAKVLNYITDKRAVINARQFPHQYAAAQESLKNLETDMFHTSPSELKDKSLTSKSGFDPIQAKKLKILKRAQGAKSSCSPDMFNRYQNALNKAVSIATFFNVSPIQGTSLIFLDVSWYMKHQFSSAKGLGQSRTVMDLARLLTNLCSKICEVFTIYEIYCEKDDTFVKSENHFSPPKWIVDVDDKLLTHLIRDKQMIDNVIVFSSSSKIEIISHFVAQYRLHVNPALLYADVDLSSKSPEVSTSRLNENDVMLSGFSDSILRFIAERGKGGQVGYIDKINEKYGLSSFRKINKSNFLSIPQSVENVVTPRWHTVRVFVSSTFLDMHGERNLLINYVFPELRHRARALHIDLREVDLRWGITASQANNDKLLEICMEEVLKCQLFIGILGERYGYVPQSYDSVKDNTNLSWVLNYPPGLSVTELEFHLGALANAEENKQRAFFYLRSSSLYKDIPKEFLSSFVENSKEPQLNLKKLKAQIRCSGLEVFDGYPCQWGGIASGVPIVTGLEEFGQRVLDNLWVALQTISDETETTEDLSESDLHDAFCKNQNSNFVGRKVLIEKCLQLISDFHHELILIHGKQGSGKSALMARLVTLVKEKYSNYPVIAYFVDATMSSVHSASVFHYLGNKIKTWTSSIEYLHSKEERNPYELFKTLLTVLSRKVDRVFIFVDGLDSLEKQEKINLLERLKINWPKGVTLICSAISNGVVYRSLQLVNTVQIVAMGIMTVSDRMQIIRHKLSGYGKTLDENMLNNQLQLLALKKDSNLPLFLSLVCEELRRFGIYEKLTEKIKSLSSTAEGLFSDFLTALEQEFSTKLISGVLGFFAVCNEGLHEEDLYTLLGIYEAYFSEVSYKKGILKFSSSSLQPLPRTTFSKLLRSIKGILQLTGYSCDQILKLGSSNITSIVYKRYKKTVLSVNGERSLHCILAGYFWKVLNPDEDSSWRLCNPRALYSLPYHLLAGGFWKDLEELLCNLYFIRAKIEARMVENLLDDYYLTNTISKLSELKQPSTISARNVIKEFEVFVAQNCHILKAFPQLTLQQALNQPNDSIVSKAAFSTFRHESQERHPLIVNWINKPDALSCCQLTLCLSKPSLCVALSPDEKCVAVGEYNVANIYELDTAKKVASFVGHNDEITDILYVGQTKLCTASMDSTISIWNIQQQYRLHVLKKHSRRVSAICCDPLGLTLVSVGWDSAIVLWKMRTGEEETLIEYNNKWSPINCVAFHPFTQSIITGSWDSALRIWSLQTRKCKAVLHGHTASIRSVHISPNGKLIVSTAMDSTLKLWSCMKGFQIASISGSVPFSSAHFTRCGNHIIASSADKTIRIYQSKVGQDVAYIKGTRHSALTSILLNSDALITGYEDGFLEMTDYVNHKTNHYGRIGTSPITCIISWHTRNTLLKHLIVGTKEGLIEVLDLNFKIEKTLYGHFSAITSLAFSPSKHLVLSGTQQGHIAGHCVDLKNKSMECMPYFYCRPHDDEVTSIVFDRSYMNFVTSSGDRSLKFWIVGITDEEAKPMDGDDTNFLTLVSTICHDDAITSMCWTSSSPSVVVTSSKDLTVCGWAITSGERLWVKKNFNAPIIYLTCTKKDNIIIGGSLNGDLYFWSDSGTILAEIPGSGEQYFSAFVNSKVDWNLDVLKKENRKTSSQYLKSLTDAMTNILVAKASSSGEVHITKPCMDKEIEVLKGHSGSILSISSGFGKKILSSSLDGSVKLWNPNVFNEGLEKTRVLSHSSEVVCIAEDVATQSVISGDREGYVVIWKKHNNHWTPILKEKTNEKPISALVTISSTKFVSASNDGVIKLWELNSVALPKVTLERISLLNDSEQENATTNFKLILEFCEKRPHPITSLLYEPRDKLLIIGMTCDSLHILSLTSFSIIHNLTLGHLWPMDEYHDIAKRLHKEFNPWTLHLRLVTFGHQPVLVLLNSFLNISVLELSQHNKVVPIANIGALPGGPRYVDDDTWTSALEIIQDSTAASAMHSCLCFIGLNTGEVVTFELSFQKHKYEVSGVTIKKVHTGAVHGISVIKLESQLVIITCGDDALVRMWKFSLEGNHIQIGQFHCASPVHYLLCTEDPAEKHERADIVCGDAIGNVYFLSLKL